MIRPEDFYNQVNQSFRDTNAKIDQYHTDNCKKIDKVAQDVNDLKVAVMSHISSSETAVSIKNENATVAREQNNHKIYWILGIFGAAQVIWEIIKGSS